MSRNNKLVFASLLAWGSGEGLWWYLLPLYIASLGANPVQIGFVLSVSMIVVTFSYIPAGWLGDRVSRKRVMTVGWFMGFVAIIVLAFAQTWQQAIPALLVYNLSGFCMPIINAYVTAEVRAGAGQDLRRVFTVVFTGYTIGTILSPAVGGWLADVWSLRNIFFLSAALFAVSTSLILLVEAQPVQRVSGGGTHVPLHNDRVFVSLVGLFFIILLATHVGVPLASNYLQDVRLLPMSWIGILGSVNALGSAVLTLGLGRWASGRIMGLIFAQAAVGLYAILMLTTGSLPLLGLALFLRGAVGAIRYLAAARLGEMLPPASLGLGYGVFQTVVNIAFTVSPYIAGWLYAFNPLYPFAANLALVIPAMVLTVAIGRQGPRPTPARVETGEV